MVCEAVQQRPGETFRAEDPGPLVEGQVGGDQNGAPLVALAEHLEEQFDAGPGKWNEAQLVDDQQVEPVELPLQIQQPSLVPGLLRLIGKAVLDAMVEDWTAESLERYWTTGQGLPVRELPDDSISGGSVLQMQLMQQLVGENYPLDDLSGVVRDFFVQAVSGTRVLEDETVSCRVVWVSQGAAADPVFVLDRNS